jgi:tetratricopeptide (TPR) repeat protein
MPLALLLLLFFQQTGDEADGIRALEAGDYTAAAAAFEKAGTADPSDYSAHFHLGLARSFLRNFPAAAESYRRVLDLKPGLYEAELNYGIVLLEMQRPADASVPLAAACEKKPSEFRPCFYHGEALLAAGRAAEAEQRLRAAIELDPKHAAAHASLGRALALQQKPAEAEAAIGRAIELDASHNSALLEVAALYEKVRRHADAIRIYERFQDDVAVRERLGDLLLGVGRAGDAIPHLEAAVKASPTPANLFALAMAFLRTSQPDRAAVHLEQALALEPGNADLRMSYGRVLRDRKDFQAAAREFWQVTQARPGDKEGWNELAAMLLRLENYPQAIAAFDRIEALGEPNAALFYFRAIAYDRTRQYKPAHADYSRFLELSKDRHPDEEFKARQRIKVIEKEMNRR